MTREEKAKYIDELVSELNESSIFYLADTADLTVEVVNSLRRRCFQSNIKMRVVKNTLLEKAMDRVEGKDAPNPDGVVAAESRDRAGRPQRGKSLRSRRLCAEGE